MKTLTLLIMLISIKSVAQQQSVSTRKILPGIFNQYFLYQTYVINESTLKWETEGSPHTKTASDSVSYVFLIKRRKIIAIQDLKLIKGKWEKYGEMYEAPDTLKRIDLLVKN
jgi:hypothetical protein